MEVHFKKENKQQQQQQKKKNIAPESNLHLLFYSKSTFCQTKYMPMITYQNVLVFFCCFLFVCYCFSLPKDSGQLKIPLVTQIFANSEVAINNHAWKTICQH